MKTTGTTIFITLLFFLSATSQEKEILTPPRASENKISWEIPDDGGTPRDPSLIRQTGPNEYHIQASFEEGGQSVLKHAVSRMDIICKNNGQTPVTITLHLDLSDGGKRTDYDNKPEAGMKWRDFLFIQSPGKKSWQQINGRTEGWISVVQFEAVPGNTKVGLSPWYTYADYLSFVASLPQSSYLEKKMIGKSDGGLEHWELTITDTTINANNKKKIFWQAREHAYETYSSFAMEGLIEFLLSEKAAEFRKRYIISIHPMTNIDGVAKGYEYRAGYDYPEPQQSQTGKLSFGAIDRLRPDYAVAWHNWIAPRDRNVVFYTDGDNGIPTTRAWLRFTQLFPSLRAAGHRWHNEDNLLRHNWEGRSLGENNIHQYAMKKYGTRIWGWEMPWWNFTVEDVRKAGAGFGRAFLTTLDELKAGKVPPAEERPLLKSPRFKMCEFEVKATANVANPYQEAMMVGLFISPSGKKLVVDGFYNGDDKWKLRFAPDEEGLWTYELRGEGINLLQRGKVHCTLSSDHGFIRTHPENAYAFALSDSVAFFPMGDTNYGLYDDSPITPALRLAYLKTRRMQGFNFVRMEVGHSVARAEEDNAFWAWGGTPQQPDLDRINPVFFKGLDSLFEQMRQLGMNAELILLNYYRFPFTDTSMWTPARERQWIHYLLSRYGAYTNIFMWTISNEYETHPDGKYRFDTADDVAWVRRTGYYIRQNDPYRHPVTVHPVISSSIQGNSPRSPFELPWRIGGFYGKDSALDVLSQQTGKTGEGISWDEKCHCWMGDDPQLTNSIAADRIYNKPVMNTENGYEYLRNYPTGKKQVHHTDKIRRTSWRIVCAGGYFAAGFRGTLGHSDIWNRIDSANHYTFVLKDEGAGAQLGYLYRFFTALPFWKMQPYKNISGNAVALADEKENVYVIYFPHGGKVKFERSGIEKLQGHWFNPRTGKFGATRTVEGQSVLQFESPDKEDWALLLTPNK